MPTLLSVPSQMVMIPRYLILTQRPKTSVRVYGEQAEDNFK
jgi:hypothetical protein